MYSFENLSLLSVFAFSTKDVFLQFWTYIGKNKTHHFKLVCNYIVVLRIINQAFSLKVSRFITMFWFFKQLHLPSSVKCTKDSKVNLLHKNLHVDSWVYIFTHFAISFRTFHLNNRYIILTFFHPYRVDKVVITIKQRFSVFLLDILKNDN